MKMYKRLSAHMDELTYQGQVHGVIYTHGEYFKYKTPMTGRLKAGTHPQRNTRGGIGADTFIVGTEAAGFIFTAPAAGTVPYRNTVFAQQTAHIDADTALNVFGYTNTPAGRIRAGEEPQRNTRGQQTGQQSQWLTRWKHTASRFQQQAPSQKEARCRRHRAAPWEPTRRQWGIHTASSRVEAPGSYKRR